MALTYEQQLQQAGDPNTTDQAVNGIGGALSKVPIFGAIAGAGVGVYNAFRAADRQREQQKILEQRQLALDTQQRRSILKSFPTKGMNTNSLYMGKGGAIGASGIRYKAEGDEVIVHSPTDNIRTDNAGGTERLATGISKFTGDKHSDPSGGIGVNQNEEAFIFSDQVKVPNYLLSLLKKSKL